MMKAGTNIRGWLAAAAALLLCSLALATAVSVAVGGTERDSLTAIEAELSREFGAEFYHHDPHWQAESCKACHRVRPEAGRLYLLGDADTTCTVCHTRGRASREPHPVGGSDSDQVHIPADFPLNERGETTCLTCHAHLPACEMRDRREKENFLRPVPPTVEKVDGEPELLNFCYGCHRRDHVAGYNPHENQLDPTGAVEPRRCLFCHHQVPDPAEEPAKELMAEDQAADYLLRKPLSVSCIGCHLLTPHTGAPEHLERPSDKTLEKMRAAQRELGVVLPLDENRRINCATCHNPHQQGVFPAGHPAGARYDEEQIPPEVLRRYQRLERPGEPGRRSFRLGLPDFRGEMRPVSELKPERKMRLPARDGTLCAACHGAGGIDR